MVIFTVAELELTCWLVEEFGDPFDERDLNEKAF